MITGAKFLSITMLTILKMSEPSFWDFLLDWPLSPPPILPAEKKFVKLISWKKFAKLTLRKFYFSWNWCHKKLNYTHGFRETVFTKFSIVIYNQMDSFAASWMDVMLKRNWTIICVNNVTWLKGRKQNLFKIVQFHEFFFII